MDRRRISVALVALILLASCAALGIKTEAESEFEQGIALFNQGKYAEAVPRFEKATTLDPNYGRAYLYLGKSYVNLGRWGQAVTPLRTAYRLAPDETRKEVLNILVDALLSTALSEFKKGNFKDSGKLLREALDLDPSKKEAQSLMKDILGE